MPDFVIASRNPLTQPAAIVRAAAPSERAGITELLLRANGEYRKVLPAPIYDAYVRGLRDLAAHWIDKEFLIAESGGRLLGAVAFYRDASYEGWGLPQECAALRALAVDPEARGQGIGRQLTEACVLRAWRIGRQLLCLHNAGFQAVGRKLYLSMGFQRCPQYDFDGGDLPDLDPGDEHLAIEAFCLNLKR